MTVLAALLAAPAVAGVPGMSEAGANGSPIRTQELAANEVLFEAGGVGFVTTRADLATMTVLVSSGGASRAEARRANRAEVGRVAAAARRAGVPADAIEIESGDSDPTLMVFDVPDEPAPGEDSAASLPHRASSLVTIRLRDIDKAADVRAALQAAGTNEVSTPLYSLTDRSQARHQAQAQALAAAQADAATHAAQRNMRVVRLVRVTERIGTDMFAIAFNNAALFRDVSGPQNPGQPQTQPDIVTVLLLGADYALAPR